MSEVESPKFVLPETALSPEDYVRICVKMTKRRFRRQAITASLIGGTTLSFGVYAALSDFGIQFLSGLMIGQGFFMLVQAVNLFSGSKRGYVQFIREPANDIWNHKSTYALSVSGIETRSTSGYTSFIPWSLTQRWENDPKTGITMFISSTNFIYLPNRILSSEAHDFLTRHLGAQMPASP